METKVCIDCKQNLHRSEFTVRPNIHKTKTININAACKKCMVKRTKVWIGKNKKKFNDYQRKWHKQRYDSNSTKNKETN